MAKTMTCLKAMDGGGIAQEARENAPMGVLRGCNTPPRSLTGAM